jgi:hypothetical protein
MHSTYVVVVVVDVVVVVLDDVVAVGSDVCSTTIQLSLCVSDGRCDNKTGRIDMGDNQDIKN